MGKSQGNIWGIIVQNDDTGEFHEEHGEFFAEGWNECENRFFVRSLSHRVPPVLIHFKGVSRTKTIQRAWGTSNVGTPHIITFVT